MVFLGWVVCLVFSLVASLGVVMVIGGVGFGIAMGGGKNSEYWAVLLPLTLAVLGWYYTITSCPFTVIVG